MSQHWVESDVRWWWRGLRYLDEGREEYSHNKPRKQGSSRQQQCTEQRYETHLAQQEEADKGHVVLASCQCCICQLGEALPVCLSSSQQQQTTQVLSFG